MADKKENDISNVFDDKELQQIIAGFDKHYKKEDEGKYKDVKNNVYNILDDRQRELEKKILGKYKSTDTMKQEHEKDLKDMLKEYYTNVVEDVHGMLSKEDRALLARTRKVMAESDEGSEEYQRASQLFHNILGIDEEDERYSLHKKLEKAINNKDKFVDFFDEHKDNLRRVYATQLQAKIKQGELLEDTGNPSPIKAQYAFEKYVADRGGKIESHRELINKKTPQIYEAYMEVEHKKNLKPEDHNYFSIPDKEEMKKAA